MTGISELSFPAYTPDRPKPFIGVLSLFSAQFYVPETKVAKRSKAEDSARSGSSRPGWPARVGGQLVVAAVPRGRI